MEEHGWSLMNAAGFIKGDGEDFRKLLRSAVTEVTYGSITVLPRPGNAGNNFIVLEDGTSVNSLGLPNKGIEGAKIELPTLVYEAHRAHKRLRLSIAALGFNDFPQLALLANECEVDVLEVNLGCPNVHDTGVRKPIFAYDLGLTRIGIVGIRNVWKEGTLEVKLSPYNDENFAVKMAKLMNLLLREGDSVVLANTEPDFMPLDADGKPRLRAKTPEGKEINAGGMGGTRLKEKTIKNVRIFKKHLRPEISITAVGAIRTGNDARDYLVAGASKYQVGTAYFKDGNPRIFSDILEELERD